MAELQNSSSFYFEIFKFLYYILYMIKNFNTILQEAYYDGCECSSYEERKEKFNSEIYDLANLDI